MKVDLDSKPNVGIEVEKSIEYLFNALNKGNKNITLEEIQALLDFTFSSASSGMHSIKERNGKGAFLRERVHAPITHVIPYYFSNSIPLEVIHPAGVRSVITLRGTEMIPQATTSQFLNKTLSSITSYIGYDKEETTADLFTGASYTYAIKKMRILLPEYKGKRIAIIVNKQLEPSTISTKTVTLGDDQNWNYIYSTLQGSLHASTGWVKSHIYDSAMIFLIVENPQDNTTELFLFKWLRAGWLRINVVSSSHIYRGSKRVLYSINKVLSNPHVPSAQNIAKKYAELRKMDENQLRVLLKEYSEKLSHIALTNPILKGNEWQPFVADGVYASTLNKA
ncbi:MAG: hypothetical protein K2M30_04845, partial [Desulfovibrionaceae bacterium]|nr:hypothetical protein [Desulfovibrionaceae bacterium]